MIRFVGAVGIALLALISFELYNGVHRVQAQERELATLKSAIEREREAIRVLKAEWSSLNQPERLQALARRHLALAPTGASQIALLAWLPLKVAGADGSPPVVDVSERPAPANAGFSEKATPP